MTPPRLFTGNFCRSSRPRGLRFGWVSTFAHRVEDSSLLITESRGLPEALRWERVRPLFIVALIRVKYS
jgi:hypothetical protein